MSECLRLILILILYVRHNSYADEFTKTEWFNIVSRTKEKCYHLAIDIEVNQTNCFGRLLIVCPWNRTKISQQWRWNGQRLESRLNGMVWRREGGLSRNIILVLPTNSTDQHFQIYPEDYHIYHDADHFFKNVVVEVHCRKPATGATINIFNRNPEPMSSQLFDFENVYE